jgi:hypothetical protein
LSENQPCYVEKLFPPVLENLSPFPFFSFLFVYLVVIAFCMLLKDEQPLKSRGIFPIMSAFFGFWSLVVNMTFFVGDFEWRSKYDCYFFIFGYNPTTAVQLIILILYSLRIVLTLQVNNHKVFIRNQNGKQTFIIRLINFLKFLTSDKRMFIIASIVYIINVVSDIVTLVLGDWSCITKPNNYLQFVYYAISYPLLIFIFFIDFILMFKSLIFCQFKKILITSDPFSFRIQQWFGATFSVLTFCIIIIYLPLLIGILVIFQDSIPLHGILTASYILFVSLVSIFFYFNLFYFAILVILLTIFNVIKRKFFQSKKEIDSKGLKECLIEEELLIEFKKFTDSEWSSENYLLYFDIITFRKLKETQNVEFASQIHRAFLNGASSELQVNLPDNIVSNVSKSIEQGLITPDLFDGVLKGVEENLGDTFSRFRLTKFYKNYFESKKFLEDQINE